MRIIRNNVFETNSSSSHVLALATKKSYSAYYMTDSVCCKRNDYTITVTYKYYGWNGSPIFDVEDKINYLFAQKYGYSSLEDSSTIEEEYTEFLKTVYPDCKNVKFIRSNGLGVDHQSCGLLNDNDISPEDFLKKPYIVIVTNDNR